MKVRLPLIALTLCLAHWPSHGRAASGRTTDEPDLRQGLVYVFFDDEGFQRPGSHGKEAQIKSHGVVTEIKSHGVDKQIDLEIDGINGYSRLWLGQIRFPAEGKVIFSAEVDNGMRLYVGEQCVIDAWTLSAPRQGEIHVAANQILPLRVEYFMGPRPRVAGLAASGGRRGVHLLRRLQVRSQDGPLGGPADRAGEDAPRPIRLP